MENTIKAVVESVLKDYPQTRDDDDWLCIRVWVRMGYARNVKDTIQIDLKNPNLKYKPSFETITRIRRHFQNDLKMYPASEEVQQRRVLQELKKHQEYSTKFMSPYHYPSNFWW